MEISDGDDKNKFFIGSKWMKNDGWKSYLCLEIVEKTNRFALLNFKIFWGQCPASLYFSKRGAVS